MSITISVVLLFLLILVIIIANITITKYEDLVEFYENRTSKLMDEKYKLEIELSKHRIKDKIKEICSKQ